MSFHLCLLCFISVLPYFISTVPVCKCWEGTTLVHEFLNFYFYFLLEGNNLLKRLNENQPLTAKFDASEQ